MCDIRAGAWQLGRQPAAPQGHSAGGLLPYREAAAVMRRAAAPVEAPKAQAASQALAEEPTPTAPPASDRGVAFRDVSREVQ